MPSKKMPQVTNEGAGRADRGPGGRFLPGHPPTPGAGRLPREREHELLSIMRAEVTPELWLSITRRAIVDAAGGDSAARSWLSKYLLPEPKHQVEVGGSLADLIAALSAPDSSTLEG